MSDETWTETHRQTLAKLRQGGWCGAESTDALDAALAEIARLTENVTALDHDYGALLKESNAEIARLQDSFLIEENARLTAGLAAAQDQAASLEEHLRRSQFVREQHVRARVEAEARVVALMQEKATLLEAWGRSWDCSRDPGHTIMQEALAAIEVP